MRRRGFTLIELLVVIGVISILMSILIPALSKARNQARAAVCLSNLHQWGVVVNMYLQDYEDCFWMDPAPDQSNASRLWMNRLADLYGENDKFRLCPSAKQPNTEAVRHDHVNAYGSSTVVWRNSGYVNGSMVIYEGSYGINHWLNDVPSVGPLAGGYAGKPECNWRKLPSESLADVPAIFDCCWYGSSPETDTTLVRGVVPLENDWLYNTFELGDGTATGWHAMAKVCVSRHGPAVNGVFLDASARKIPLPDLWTLKWHRNTVPNYDIDIPWVN